MYISFLFLQCSFMVQQKSEYRKSNVALQIAGSSRYPGVPSIVLTANATKCDREECLVAGMNTLQAMRFGWESYSGLRHADFRRQFFGRIAGNLIQIRSLRILSRVLHGIYAPFLLFPPRIRFAPWKGRPVCCGLCSSCLESEHFRGQNHSIDIL